jgi:hypothetical protein
MICKLCYDKRKIPQEKNGCGALRFHMAAWRKGRTDLTDEGFYMRVFLRKHGIKAVLIAVVLCMGVVGVFRLVSPPAAPQDPTAAAVGDEAHSIGITGGGSSGVPEREKTLYDIDGGWVNGWFRRSEDSFVRLSGPPGLMFPRADQWMTLMLQRGSTKVTVQRKWGL